MKGKRSAKLVSGWASFILAITLLSPGIIHADEIEKKRESIKNRDKEIQRLEKEKALTEKELKSLYADLETEKRKLARLDEEVYSLEKKLKKSSRRLKEKESQLQEQERLYENRLRTIYQQGKMFYVESLLNSQSLEQFLNRLKFVKLVADRDQELINRYREDRASLKEEKARYQNLLEDHREKQEEARSIHSRLMKEYKDHETQLNKLAKKQEHLEEVNEEEKEKVRELIRRKQQENEKKSGDASYEGGKFRRPVEGPITSGFGMRYHPTQGVYKMHTGVDFGASLGTPIYAAAAGKVIEARPAAGYGYIVVIDHGGGLSTLYAHMYSQDVKVKTGESVAKGQAIAAVGNNGWSTGPHLHFEVLKNGEPIDPMEYLK
ncbi:murein DD-endopeptidase MepM/ murein hydrolase activator NlpD [Melghirimyces profundicolus]|uniref:Murein DD-endopeptidase MepM/ murein hydrolase activator NlpD n=1 Tax=Melghirimyces profundicolus TaxID=1242148 RepID=A0A2T6BUC2_9BACL|nr:M23 family metallopeptidase [Melghirimyces profundicolus]PTX59671.1 murein DD-endopeptidase MepM/ murein hydrolase activator NlpD [Melghirimyces profundicolus]